MADKNGYTSVKTNTDNLKRTGTKRSTKIVAWCLIILNVLLLAALLSLVIGWREYRKKSLTPHEQTVCQNCTEIGLDGKELPKEMAGKITRDMTGNSTEWICCGYTSDVLNWMVTKAIHDRGTSVKSSLYPLISKECKKTTQAKPSAQVNGISVSEMAKEQTDVIQWNTTESSFMGEGITYKNGRLTIKQPGYYYIFSQIKLKNIPLSYSTSDVFASETLPNHWNHYIFHVSSENGKEQKILESSRSRCEMPNSGDETTSSFGAVFYLAENDEVFVNTSHPQYLAPCEEGNHFGLYMT
ncbi:tumor necrosis factor ligand superfamily member 14-like [Mercenaria mercenaria]|uniref:tumor necrosis factor ligand superfamily member 14-like n=1 Tax=Mercenaria mercenaria TaxID=6596 RepID=UPI00234FA145|nr:tumor necrosis factor ligand superfamily member 14-like [Mercenaria mercenaria]